MPAQNESCHDLQATSTLRAIQILLGHTKIENTGRYLGVDIKDALLLAERTGERTRFAGGAWGEVVATSGALRLRVRASVR